jgi:hypothetical protein
MRFIIKDSDGISHIVDLPHEYGLGFISDADLFRHVKDTLEHLTMAIDLNKFEKNLIDPIKLTFEMHAYHVKAEGIIQNEIARQLGKTVENAIGWFHQNIFRYISGWDVPSDGMDVVNVAGTIYGEIKNKYNTMNSSSAESVFQKLYGVVLGNKNATAYLIEVIAKKSQDVAWAATGHVVNGDKAERIRRISIDRFYEIAVNRKYAFRDLCSVLGLVIDDVLVRFPARNFQNTVLKELKVRNSDLVKAIFLSSFSTYNGFEDYHARKA